MKQMTILEPSNVTARGWAHPGTELQEQSNQRPRKTLWKRILVAVDFSEDSLAALQYGVELAKQHGASLSLAHIVEKAPFMADMRNVVLAHSDEEVAKASQLLLARLARTQVPKDIPVQYFVRIGKVAKSLEKLGAELETDLVIVATHGYRGLKRWWFGSVSDQIVKTCRRAVLVVSPEKGATPINIPSHTPAQTA